MERFIELDSKIEFYGSLRLLPEIRTIPTAILFCALQKEAMKAKENDFFQKFITHSPKNEFYKIGNSITEQYFLSEDEVRASFKVIVKSYKSFTDFNKAELEGKDIFDGKFFLSVNDRLKHLLYFKANTKLINEKLQYLNSINLKYSDLSKYDYGYIYLLYCKKNNIYKIGKSINAEDRLKQLNNLYSMYEFEIIEKYKIENYLSKVEEFLHYNFKKFRVKAELFDFDTHFSKDEITSSISNYIKLFNIFNNL